MGYFVEIRTTTSRSGPIRVVPLEDVDRYRGFRSAFAWDAELAEHVIATNSTRDLRGVEVYCDQIFVDFDGTDPTQLLQYLSSEKVGYLVFDSGNRSTHVHIPIVPILGDWVPRSVKEFLKRHAPGADLSFIHPAGMYRLPGTYHKKTGRSKELLTTVEGSLLVITEAPERTYSIRATDSHEATAEKYYAMLMLKRGPGQRSPHIWTLARTAADLGLTTDEAFRDISWWNSRFADPPQDTRTIERQIGEGFKHLIWSSNESNTSKVAKR